MTEFRPGSFQILPTIIKNLIIINVLAFLAQQVFENNSYLNIDNMFALHTWQSDYFKPWQFVTYLFMHGSLMHLFGNMFALWMFGSVLEGLWGPKRFLTFYIVCGLGAAFCHMLILFIENQSMIHAYDAINANSSNYMNDIISFNNKYGPHTGGLYQPEQIIYSRLNEPTLGASGAVFGCLAAFGYLFPNTYIYLYFFLPLKVKWFVILYAGYELLMAIQNSAGDNVAHFAHLGGALVGLIMVYFWNKNNRKTFY